MKGVLCPPPFSRSMSRHNRNIEKYSHPTRIATPDSPNTTQFPLNRMKAKAANDTAIIIEMIAIAKYTNRMRNEPLWSAQPLKELPEICQVQYA